MNTAIFSAIIGAISAITISFIKDILVQYDISKTQAQKQLIQQRLEKAYVPLAHLLYMYTQNEDQTIKDSAKNNIQSILYTNSHYISQKTCSAIYILLDDTSVGLDLINNSFFKEIEDLKKLFYKLHYTRI